MGPRIYSELPGYQIKLLNLLSFQLRYLEFTTFEFRLTVLIFGFIDLEFWISYLEFRFSYFELWI